MTNTRELFRDSKRCIILTHTREEYDNVIDCLDKAGFTWHSGDKLKRYDLYSKYGTYICVKDKTVTYESMASAIISDHSYNYGTQILMASEIYYEADKFHKGDKVKIVKCLVEDFVGLEGKVIDVISDDSILVGATMHSKRVWDVDLYLDNKDVVKIEEN